jgi:hypothetical protein
MFATFKDLPGFWSEWAVTDCPVTCGGGFKRLVRSCSNPEPGINGTQCPISDPLTKDGDACNLIPCVCKSAKQLSLLGKIILQRKQHKVRGSKLCSPGRNFSVHSKHSNTWTKYLPV